ncbi:polyprenyl synthetase family protein [Macrococcus equipercicus]|uniref:Polyprenyl synthetase family protein n=1 Tax=Macrococcus equipercicus TaxID=69967 RepID=A0ABQ6RA05_9STAP|nr:farnesyl diphosphate synthase [Macrococcus equipercicus]KAA1040129.1 polyprenyl synthetase family protein [Macrococcus equipercicus]
MKHKFIELINDYMSHLYDDALSAELDAAMNYSLSAGGKRIRPVLLLTTLEMCGEKAASGLSAAAAIEMIHTYSLIHDDLPAMDDDDYRRGKLTNHRVYGEATAILAGDGLLTDSFYHVMSDETLTAEVKVELVRIISRAAGSRGMVGGQMLDMAAEHRQLTRAEMEEVHLHKTGDLIRACFLCAGVIARLDDTAMAQLHDLGTKVGLLFQIKDDILDVEGSLEEMGKTAGSDAQNDKATYVTLLGLPAAKQAMTDVYHEAVELVSQLTENCTSMMELLDYIVARTK